MKKAFSTLAASLSLFSLASAQAATVEACITPAEMHGLIAYFLPDVLARTTEQCRVALPADSYLVTDAPKLAGELADGRATAWPAAKSAFLKFGGPTSAKDVADLPDAALRPLVDAAIASKFTFTIKPADCIEVNDIAEALAPLSAEQTVHLGATIFSAVARRDRKMRSCPRQAQ